MGINGLLPLLKSIHRPVNLKKFEGKTLGIDAYGWLHRGTVACAMEIAKGQPTRKFVDFCMHRVRMLQHFGVVPFLVFDGDYLPSKAATESERSKRREESKRSGYELESAGKLQQAYAEFQKAVDVTPEMARQLIDELKITGVQYLVAPYEADAQMVYLERKGIIQGILSEDSDLLVFGAKCLLTKLDQYGNCVEINKADFCACKEITLTGWSDKEFRQMAILSGCDYLSSINNMGLKTAYRMLRKHKNVEKVVRMLQFDGKFHVPKGYLEAFNQAELTFLHQRVFCPKTQRVVFHTEPESPVDEEKMHFIGAYVPPEIAQGVAKGDLNPMTKQPIIVRLPSKTQTSISTPFSSRPQYRTSVSSADLKKGVSIEEFFKPRRTPLAELDPNCFTPSPNQQDALRRNSGPWNGSPAPRQYINRAMTEPDLPQSAPPERLPTARHARAPTISEPRPPKRARLCADEDVLFPNRNVQLGPSKFFKSEYPDPSPTAGRAKSRKSRKMDITVFSDDSIEEVMLNLPELVSSKAGGVQKMSIFEDAKLNESDTNLLPGPRDCAEVITIHKTDDVQDKVPSLTASTSATSSFEQPATPTATPSSASLNLLHEKYSFQNSQSKAVNYSGPFSSAISVAKPSKLPVAVKSNNSVSTVNSISARMNMTPLQRLGVSAINRSRLPMTPPQTPILPRQNASQHQSLLRKGLVPFPEVASEKMKRIVDPASIPLPPPDESENVELMQQKGSEDLIIHDSEEEDEAISPVLREDVSARLDFSKFVHIR
ncbi:PIN [Glarea lozoyensis ATCC 20868]|uniref:PIN n=1 Tax=Glarea lozoyensis (strain ATCC 20868 / MF5171) TaxID=1116229 RepID=S3DJW2_GLAL2|nr:PIN [Glarea lozoyensis ATCC 20868]EPE26808.1 PIN [Glarea lozoyensis ATCC 20868]